MRPESTLLLHKGHREPCGNRTKCTCTSFPVLAFAFAHFARFWLNCCRIITAQDLPDIFHWSFANEHCSRLKFSGQINLNKGTCRKLSYLRPCYHIDKDHAHYLVDPINKQVCKQPYFRPSDCLHLQGPCLHQHYFKPS
jgi:hypothetical protein